MKILMLVKNVKNIAQFVNLPHKIVINAKINIISMIRLVNHVLLVAKVVKMNQYV